MVIIVPRDVEGLERIEKNLEKVKVKFNIFSILDREIKLSIPRFKIETTLDLTDHLKEV